MNKIMKFIGIAILCIVILIVAFVAVNLIKTKINERRV